jgi:hypothetical protein
VAGSCECGDETSGSGATELFSQLVYTMGIGGPFPGSKDRPGRDADHSPHLMPKPRMSRSYTSSPSKRLHGV